ncbi:MAG: helix-turn-helix domain-containing protein [Phycisphaerales bacterium JB063]
MHNFPSTAPGDAHIDAVHLYRLWDAEEDQHYAHTRRWPTWDGHDWASPITPQHTALVAIRTSAGRGTVTTQQGHTHTLGPESVLILPWQHLHQWHTTQRHWRLWWFEFFLTQPEHAQPYAPLQLPYTQAEDARIRTIQRELRRPAPPHQRLASAHFAALLYGWTLHHTPADRPADPRIERVINAMHDRVHENLTVPQLADIANLTPRAFADAFERATGSTPKRYHHTLRLDTARSLLMTGRFTVQRVAEHLQFSSPFHLSRAYKKHFGHPPSQAH